MTATTLLPLPGSSESKQELGQFFTPTPVDLLRECATTLFDNFQASAEVFFANHECARDGFPSVSAWDAQQSKFFLVDLGDHVDAAYFTGRGQADEVLTHAGIAFVRIVAFRNRQEMVERLDWIPMDTIVWIASEPKHHIDLGGNRLIGPRATQ